MQGAVQMVVSHPDVPMEQVLARSRAPQPGLAAPGYNNVLLADPLPSTHPMKAFVQLKHVILQ